MMKIDKELRDVKLILLHAYMTCCLAQRMINIKNEYEKCLF